MTLVLFTAVNPAAAHAYETCTSANNYLEAMLPEPDPLPMPDDPAATPLPEACVEAAHLSLAPTGYYGFCPTSEGQPGRTHPRPCVSRKYVGVIHSTLLNVCDCLGFDPHLAFATFNLESALHLNAVGAATDVGVGQLTKTAIDEVTLNALDAARRRAQKSERSSCRLILPFMTPHDSAKTNRCGFMSLPENPTRNITYAVLLIQQNRKSIERYWTRLNPALSPQVNTERLKERLTMLAYNSGPAGPMATLKAYTEQMGSRVNERLLDFESSDFNSFVVYLSRYYPVSPGQEAVRQRVSRYVGYVIQAARRVQNLARTACFAPDTFAPPDRSGPTTLLDGDEPDPVQARHLINIYLTRLARDFATDNGDKSGDCRLKQRKFLFEFLGGSAQGPRDLPPGLSEIYAGLCAR